jgi:hypothetical protein
MSQLIRAIEEFNKQLLRSLFSEPVEYNESLGAFAWKGERITEDDVSNALKCKVDGGDSYSLTKNQCEQPSREY